MHVSQIRRLPDDHAEKTGGLLNRPEGPVKGGFGWLIVYTPYK
jgi:hypothetical protein